MGVPLGATTSLGTDEPRRPRVLIVDDEPANIQLLAEALGESCEIQFATRGERALELATSGEVDLTLLDVTMPEMDGFEVCRRIKADERSRGTLVIFVTARGEVADEARGFEVGGVDYITKPISPPIVRARVRTQLELKRARDLLEKLAAIDGLTGLANRRSLDERLRHEWQRALRSQGRLSLALADVDHFKALNDHSGHARGDEVLRTLSPAFRAVARRPADLAARYGGEEFALLLPGIGLGGAGQRVTALMGEITGFAIPHPTSPTAPRLTISVGAVRIREGGPKPALGVLKEAMDALGAAIRSLPSEAREAAPAPPGGSPEPRPRVRDRLQHLRSLVSSNHLSAKPALEEIVADCEASEAAWLHEVGSRLERLEYEEAAPLINGMLADRS